MKGIVFDLKRFATHDGPGIRTSVFLKGCPLKCLWCHNPESINPKPEMITILDRKKCLDLSSSCTTHQIGREISSQDLFKELIKDKPFFEESGGGLTFTGGEPLLQSDFLLELLTQAKTEKIHTAVDTSGFADFAIFEKINPFTDLYLYDLKIIHTQSHLKYTQVENSIILENLKKLNKIARKIYIRIPLIPDLTDHEDNIHQICEFVQDYNTVEEISLLPFNSLYLSKYQRFNMKSALKNTVRQSDKHLLHLKQIAESYHLKVNIGG